MRDHGVGVWDIASLLDHAQGIWTEGHLAPEAQGEEAGGPCIPELASQSICFTSMSPCFPLCLLLTSMFPYLPSCLLPLMCAPPCIRPMTDVCLCPVSERDFGLRHHHPCPRGSHGRYCHACTSSQLSLGGVYEVSNLPFASSAIYVEFKPNRAPFTHAACRPR